MRYTSSYHHKVPPNVADLELKATYGLAAPQEFSQPEKNASWTVEAYKAFDITQKTEPDPVSDSWISIT